MINLLSEKKVKFDRSVSQASKVKRWSGVALVGYVLVLVLVLVVGQIITIKRQMTEKALDKAKLTLVAKSVFLDQYTGLIKRSGVIQTLLDERRESIELLNKVRAMLPAGVELVDFTLKEDGLGIGFRASNVLFANQMMDIVETGFADLGSESTSVRIARSQDASYLINAEITLK